MVVHTTGLPPPRSPLGLTGSLPHLAGDSAPASVRDALLRVVTSAESCRLWLALVPSLLQDRRHRRIRHEALPPLRIPVEQDPNAVLVVRIPEHLRALRPVLPPLLRALGREDPLELVEILDFRRCEHHRHYALPRGFSAPLLDADGAATLLLPLLDCPGCSPRTPVTA